MTTSFVPFDSQDIKAVMEGKASRGTVFAVLTSQTCGENCWHAREEVCRCSCGGKNHGCLNNGTTRPERTSRIDGHLYKLKAVGRYQDIVADACEINRLAGFKTVEKPTRLQSGEFSQYRYTWQTTDCGSPARLKTATDSQRKWPELAGWKDERCIYLLWERITMPERPMTKAIDRNTGEILADQLPDHCF